MRTRIRTSQRLSFARAAPVTADADLRERMALEVGGVIVLALMCVQLEGAVGTVLAGVQVLVSLIMFATSPSQTAKVLTRWGLLLALPVFASLSAFWSISPEVSLRYGAQFVFTAFVGIFLAARLGATSLLRIVVLSFSIALVLGLLSGRVGASMQGPVLVGLTGSKNQFAGQAQIAILAAFSLLFVRDAAKPLRLWCLLLLPLAAFALLQSNASGPLVVTAAGLVMLCILLPLQRLPPVGRLAALVALGVLLAPFLAVGPEIATAAERFVVDGLGKDPTLTGRTTLWLRADELTADRPWLGYGYMASWVGEHPIAVGLRTMTGMEDGRGFNFHDTYRQFAVDMGRVGLAVFALQLAFALFGTAARFISSPSAPQIFFLTLLGVTIVRMPTEVFLQAFSTQAVLFFGACVVAWSALDSGDGSSANAPADGRQEPRRPRQVNRHRRQA